MEESKALNKYYFWVLHFISGVFSSWSLTIVWCHIGQYSLSSA